MSWRLTPEERRIITRTQREGMQAATPAGGDAGADCDADGDGKACCDAGGDGGDINGDIGGDNADCNINVDAFCDVNRNGNCNGDSDRYTNSDTSATPAVEGVPWRSMLSLIAGIALFILLALLMVWVGSLFG